MRDRITPALDETQLPSPRPSWLSLCAKSNSAGSRCCLPCKGAVRRLLAPPASRGPI